MQNGRIREAVILAAGNGRRMASSSLPKPLVTVAGRPLLEHVLGSLRGMGVERVTLVVGYRGSEIEGRFPSCEDFVIRWVTNPDYGLPNGISLLAVDGLVTAPFLLLMSDHLFERDTLRNFLAHPIPQDGGVLATDRKIAQVFDLEDATKVDSENNLVRRMGKHLAEFDSIDTGMFLLTPTVFAAMRHSQVLGDASLTGGITTLAGQSAVRTWDIGERRWIDIDTPEAREEAERMVANGHLR